MTKFQQIDRHSCGAYGLRFALVVSAALCLFLGACGATPPPPTAAQPTAQPQPTAVPQPTPAALAALAQRVSPCAAVATPDAPAANAAQPAETAPLLQATEPMTVTPALVHYDDSSNTIELRKGAWTTLAGVSSIISRTDALRELAPGEWLLSANLRVEAGARLRIAAPEVRWLKLHSDDKSFVWLKAQGGQLEFDSACVSSWDDTHHSYDENYANGRSFVLARGGSRMSIHASDLRYLGYDGPESYGIAWRQTGTTGEILDSFVSHNFYGLYSFEVDDLVIRGNETHHNVMYGIDPHTRSMRLVIENNVSHDNGKHGIILAEECSNGVIRNNVVYNNLHHGIVIYQRSNNNLVEGNTAYGNGGHGININDAANNTVRDNNVYGNLEVGIGVGQHASANQLLGNSVRANRKDGISFYSDVTDNVLRDNTIDGNARYGIYVKSEGDMQMEGNQVVGNTVGVYLNRAKPLAISREANQIHDNHEADLHDGNETPAVSEGDQP